MENTTKQTSDFHIDYEFNALGTIGERDDSISKDILRNTSSAANTTQALLQKANLQSALDNFAKDLFRCFVTDTIDVDDLLCNTVNNDFSSFAGFCGAYGGAQIAASIASAKATAIATGAVIGSAAGPVGTIIGSVVGGIVIGLGSGAIIGKATRDGSGNSYN
jgi:hypothetical protein